ncbi:DUF4178 domain-containing protein [Thalassotalea sp. Y01]|uniref:DUF4178 domain-containing protein n=1 Tax=Thalassotalea sp. Y01 TaxID=2729613 RepID=UPI00145C59AD|nr:DUF4178 domain-containing protein [Thalassotalea sp. Y01]NMP15133.1 DUF4178 domain-containing protein [Thalassotalea sp. Y01]
MSFFKKLFGKPEEQRKLNRVDDLKVDDIFIFDDSFALPELLRGAQFLVSAVNSYEYEHHTETEWVLIDDRNTQIYLSLYKDDETYLKISLKLNDDDVAELFDLDQFANIFEQGETIIDKHSDTPVSDGWSSDTYRQYTFAKVGYFHRKDHRSEQISEYQGKDQGERFELYQLEGSDDRFGMDLEVWDDGDTDVFLHMYRPLTDIKDMYPGS